MSHRPVLTTDEITPALTDLMSFFCCWYQISIHVLFCPKCFFTRTRFLLRFVFLIYREEFIWCVTDLYWRLMKLFTHWLLKCLQLLMPSSDLGSVLSQLFSFLSTKTSLLLTLFLVYREVSRYDVSQTYIDDRWNYSDTDWFNVFFLLLVPNINSCSFLSEMFFYANSVFAEICLPNLPRRIHLMCYRPVLTTDETIQTLIAQMCNCWCQVVI